MISIIVHVIPFFPLSFSIEGLPNPYMVLMDFDVSSVQSHATMLGFDAISTYALPGGTLDVSKSFSISFLIIRSYLYFKGHSIR